MSRFTPPPLKEIALETAKGRQIPNAQQQEISPSERTWYRRLEQDYAPDITRRSDLNPRYNCHGMTFASRRTGIVEDSAIYHILDDDSYEEIELDDVLPGDVILYFNETGGVEHSGVVVSTPEERLLRIPIVYSKWAKYAELLHPAHRCPYSFANVRYYRVKP